MPCVGVVGVEVLQLDLDELECAGWRPRETLLGCKWPRRVSLVMNEI